MTWLKKYFTFKGRINRSTYIKYLAIPVGGGCACVIALTIINDYGDGDLVQDLNESLKIFIGLLVGYFNLAAIVVVFCCSVRRVHDFNKSGGHTWLYIIPIIGWFWSLEMLFRKGTEGPNDYGPEPNSIPVSNKEEE